MPPLEGQEEFDDLPGTGGMFFPIEAIAFSPDGKLLAIQRAIDLILWDATTDKFRTLHSTVKVARQGGRDNRNVTGGDGPAIRVAFSSDSKSLVALHLMGQIRRWDIESGKVKTTVRAGKYRATTLSQISADGRRVMHFSRRGPLVIDTQNGKVVRLVRMEMGGAMTMAISGDGRVMAFCRGDRKIQVSDIDTGERLGMLGFRQKPPLALMLSQDGSVLISNHRYVSGQLASNAQGGFDINATATGKIYTWEIPNAIRSPGDRLPSKSEK